VVTPTGDLAHAAGAARVTGGFASIVARVTDESAADETVTHTDADTDDHTDTDGDGDTGTGTGTDDGPTPGRVSRWDRPPAPHDWRFFVGSVGRILIATGLLMFGFVAYQLWGTGIETARAQNELEHQFEDLLDEPTDEQSSNEQSTGEQTTDEQSTGEQSTGEQSTGEQVTDEQTTDEQTTDEVVVPAAVDLSDRAVVQEPVPIKRGQVLARLEIPRIGVSEYVVPGVTVDDLKKGPGHYPDSPLPGQLGNTAVAGHRTTYGAPFFDVDQLEAGDELIFTMVNGDRFVYLVTFTEIVSASSYHVVTTTDPDIAEATLTSCDPKYTARDRIVVHSVLDPERSSIVGIPTFYELDSPTADDEPIPGDDPVLSSDEATDDASGGTVDETTEEISEASTGDESDESDEASAGAGEPDRGVTDDPQPIDAFSQGWFGDREAFPQIGMWALVLVAIALFSYRVAERFRRVTFGVLVGVVPFVVALYFFYQNVNRLLPPGI
jgi:sortase A